MFASFETDAPGHKYTNTITQLHKHTNTQLHNYSKNTQMSSSFETYHPGPPEEFLPRIKTGDS